MKKRYFTNIPEHDDPKQMTFDFRSHNEKMYDKLLGDVEEVRKLGINIEPPALEYDNVEEND